MLASPLKGKLRTGLQAYVDGSKRPTGHRTLFLAGYGNDAEKWLGFSEEWERTLGKAPRLDSFHRVEAKAMQGRFRGWGPDDRDRKVMALAQVVADAGLGHLPCLLVLRPLSASS